MVILLPRALLAALLLVNPGQMVGSWLGKSRALNALAGALGGKCWNVPTFSVQVLGRTMCLADRGTAAVVANGGSARVAALKAIGLSVVMLTKEDDDQKVHNRTVDRIRAYAVLLQKGTREEIPLVAAPLREFTRPLALERSQYQLSVSAVGLTTVPTPRAPVNGSDPLGFALLARSAALTQALDRVTYTVGQQLRERDANIRSGQAVAAAAARQDAEQTAIATYLDAVRTSARNQNAQLAAYMTLEREKAYLLEQLRFAALPSRTNW